ncbi:hypothetical protein B0F90DRAFT_1757013, partial [Multifurca ochricompacta]
MIISYLIPRFLRLTLALICFWSGCNPTYNSCLNLHWCNTSVRVVLHDMCKSRQRRACTMFQVHRGLRINSQKGAYLLKTVSG